MRYGDRKDVLDAMQVWNQIFQPNLSHSLHSLTASVALSHWRSQSIRIHNVVWSHKYTNLHNLLWQKFIHVMIRHCYAFLCSVEYSDEPSSGHLCQCWWQPSWQSTLSIQTLHRVCNQQQVCAQFCTAWEYLDKEGTSRLVCSLWRAPSVPC